MTLYRAYQVSAFTKDVFTGNPVGVVPLGAYLVHHNLIEHNGEKFEFQGIQ